MIKRLVIRIFNIIFIAAAAVCIALYFTQPFMKVDASITIQAEMLEDMMAEQGEGIDFKEIAGDGIKVELPVVIEPSSLFRSIASQDNETYVKEEIIDKNVDKIVDTVYPTLLEVVKKTAKQVTKKEVKKEAIAQVSNLMGGTAEEAVAKLNQAFEEDGGFDGFVDNKTNEILNLFEEGTTVTELTSEIVNTLDDVQEKLKSIDDPNNPIFGDGFTVNEEQLAQQITQTLDTLNLVDEEGNIASLDEAINSLLSSLLGGENGNNPSPSPKIMRRGSFNEDEVSEDTAAELKETIRNYINELIPEDLVPTLVLVLKITAFVLIGIMAFWGLFGVFTLIKTFAPFRPYTWCGPVFIISSVIQVLLGIGLTVALPILKDTEFIKGFVNGLMSQGNVKGLTFDLSVGTSMLVPAIIILVMFVLSFVYNGFKRSIKKQHKLNISNK